MMLKFKNDLNGLEHVETTDLKSKMILERGVLQKAIITSWDEFRKEIGYPNLYLIGQEVKPHDSVGDSIDILAFDGESLTPIVIELKREKDKLQLLQALSYAAMISDWTASDFIDEATSQMSPELDDLKADLAEIQLTQKPKIVLISERYDPEVILTSYWLHSKFGVDITAFGMDVFDNSSNTYMSIIQRYPLPELQDAYVSRRTKSERSTALEKITWDDVVKKLSYSWGERLIERCKKVKEGEPGRRRFGSIRKKYDGFSWISVNFRTNKINVYLRGFPNEAEKLLQSKFKDKIDISSWEEGYSFDVHTENQADDLLAWLKL